MRFPQSNVQRAANKAEAVSPERNLLVWNGIFVALFLSTLQVT
jgi:hypothetical protein